MKARSLLVCSFAAVLPISLLLAQAESGQDEKRQVDVEYTLLFYRNMLNNYDSKNAAKKDALEKIYQRAKIEAISSHGDKQAKIQFFMDRVDEYVKLDSTLGGEGVPPDESTVIANYAKKIGGSDIPLTAIEFQNCVSKAKENIRECIAGKIPMDSWFKRSMFAEYLDIQVKAQVDVDRSEVRRLAQEQNQLLREQNMLLANPPRKAESKPDSSVTMYDNYQKAQEKRNAEYEASRARRAQEEQTELLRKQNATLEQIRSQQSQDAFDKINGHR